MILPFIGTKPLLSVMKPPILLSSALHSLEMWIFRGSPFDSILDEVLTVSPNRQYRGMARPTTPATTGPDSETETVYICCSLIINSRLSRCSTARGSCFWLSLGDSTWVKACKSFLFTEGFLTNYLFSKDLFVIIVSSIHRVLLYSK